MKNHYWKFLSLTCICAVFMFFGATGTFAYELYDDGEGAGCVECHDEFVGGSGAYLHDLHTAINDECSYCHSPDPGDKPVGVAYMGGAGCAGCHGRNGDLDHDGDKPGAGAGLRQKHGKPLSTCGGCHLDVDPASYTPVGASNLPPLYTFTPAWEPNPCSDALDNDGNGLEDSPEDPDCEGVTYEISGVVGGCIACHPFAYSEGVPLALSGDADDITTTEGQGTYSFEVESGTYTVTPSLEGHTFGPEAIRVRITITGLSTADFTATGGDACTPDTECTVGFECGTDDDGCGGTIPSCGTCTGGDTCNNNVCVPPACTPTITDCSAEAECGEQLDDCGDPIDCGTCDYRDTCVGNSCVFLGSGDGTISGTITGEVVAGVQVNLESIDGSGALTLTDSIGAYSFNDYLSGLYIIRPLAQDVTFDPVRIRVRLEDNDITGVDFASTEGECTPYTECTVGFECGTDDNGCGGTIDCGDCSGEDTCENNVCVSEPPEPPEGTTVLSLADYNLAIWDFSDTYEQSLTQDNDTDLTYTLIQDAKGKLTGEGEYVSNFDNMTIPVTVKGKVKLKKDTVTVDYTVKGKNENKDKFQNKYNLELNDNATETLDGNQKGKICRSGEKCNKIDNLPASLPVAEDMTGEAWVDVTAEFDEKVKLVSGESQLLLSNDDLYDLETKGKFSSKKSEKKFNLKGDNETTKGIKIKAWIETDNGTATKITGKALGQKLKYKEQLRKEVSIPGFLI